MPVTVKQLVFVHKQLLAGLWGGAGVWAGLMLGFFFLLRVNIAAERGTAYEGKYILLRKHVRFYTHDEDDRSEVQPTPATAASIRRAVIVVTKSKNDRLAFTRTQYRVSHPFLCVVKALVAWAIATAGLPQH
jgi:hypothetical protein